MHGFIHLVNKYCKEYKPRTIENNCTFMGSFTHLGVCCVWDLLYGCMSLFARFCTWVIFRKDSASKNTSTFYNMPCQNLCESDMASQTLVTLSYLSFWSVMMHWQPSLVLCSRSPVTSRRTIRIKPQLQTCYSLHTNSRWRFRNM